MKSRVALSWSGGKDSCLALYELLRDDRFSVERLICTVTEGYERVSMHGVRVELIEAQAASLGIPLYRIYIPQNCSNQVYDERMRYALSELMSLGINAVAFGDIFLEDIRTYRESRLSEVGVRALFPLWGRSSKDITLGLCESGFRSVVVCVDSTLLDPSFLGRDIDLRFLGSLPEGVDPAGENGEFHSFVYDGPIFSRSVPFKKGEVVVRDNRFYYCDLVPAG